MIEFNWSEKWRNNFDNRKFYSAKAFAEAEFAIADNRYAKFNCFERQTCPEFSLFFPEVVSGLDRKPMSHVDRLFLVH